MTPKKLAHYFDIAKAISMASKDRRTKVGAVIVGTAGEIRATGYNGQPRLCNDDREDRQEYPLKALYFAHAEENAIANAARVGTPLAGSAIVVTKAPCCTCMRMIINAGICRVVPPPIEPGGDWPENCTEATRMAHEAGVAITYYVPPFTE